MADLPNEELVPVDPPDDAISPYDEEDFEVQDGVGVHDPEATELDPNTDPDREW